MKKTFTCLHGWYVSLVEKFGWVMLSLNDDDDPNKIVIYQERLHKLHASLLQKINEIHDNDKKDDLNIMAEKISYITEYIDKIILKQNKIKQNKIKQTPDEIKQNKIKQTPDEIKIISIFEECTHKHS